VPALTIAVPTYHRPDDLRELLPALEAQARALEAQPDTDYTVEILVIDNDPLGSGREVVQEVSGARYVVEPHPGIASVRNRALDEARGSTLLAFIDDDERPRDGWLAPLVRTWEETGAAVVSGRVITAFGGPLDPWLEAGGFFARRTLPTGTDIDIASTNNLLLDLDQVRASGVRFALDLGLSGGEDTLFTRQVHHAGYRMVWCDESAIVDRVPAHRQTRSWVLRRALSHGNSAAVVEVRLAGGKFGRLTARVGALVGGAGRVVGGVARVALGLLTRSVRHQARGSRAAYRGIGMLWGALGGVYQEYARPVTNATS
jgi:glycosyltransferase involved in cell wall biosynthesis